MPSLERVDLALSFMTDSDSPSDPWQELPALLDESRHAELHAAIRSMTPVDRARTLSRLSAPRIHQLLESIEPTFAAGLVEAVPDSQAFRLLAEIPAPTAANIVQHLPEERGADLLQRLDERSAAEIYQHLPETFARQTRTLAAYPPDTAGGLMSPHFLAYRGSLLVREVIDDMRDNNERYRGFAIQYLYVVDDRNRLLGVLPLRRLLLSPRGTHIEEIMVRNPLRLPCDAGLEAMRELFDSHGFRGVPVVESANNEVLVGVVEEKAIRSASERRTRRTFLKMAGIVGGDELRSAPLRLRSTRRLAFLAPNIALNLLAASVIAHYQETLEAAVFLAVFLPIISDMSGCSGGQSVAVSLRELTLGVIRPHEFGHVVAKEALVGLINGAILGLLLGGAAILWFDSPWAGLIVAVALAANTLLSVVIGGLIPLVLRGLRLDPALASGLVLTTVTDFTGFLFVLSLGTALLDKL